MLYLIVNQVSLAKEAAKLIADGIEVPAAYFLAIDLHLEAVMPAMIAGIVGVYTGGKWLYGKIINGHNAEGGGGNVASPPGAIAGPVVFPGDK
jgi:hypothetical protein